MERLVDFFWEERQKIFEMSMGKDNVDFSPVFTGYSAYKKPEFSEALKVIEENNTLLPDFNKNNTNV